MKDFLLKLLIIVTLFVQNMSNNDNLVLLKEIDTEPIELTFNLTVADRNYSPVSKYYKYSYKLDINDVWKQLEKKGYPKIYS